MAVGWIVTNAELCESEKNKILYSHQKRKLFIMPGHCLHRNDRVIYHFMLHGQIDNSIGYFTIPSYW